MENTIWYCVVLYCFVLYHVIVCHIMVYVILVSIVEYLLCARRAVSSVILSIPLSPQQSCEVVIILISTDEK